MPTVLCRKFTKSLRSLTGHWLNNPDLSILDGFNTVGTQNVFNKIVFVFLMIQLIFMTRGMFLRMLFHVIWSRVIDRSLTSHWQVIDKSLTMWEIVIWSGSGAGLAVGDQKVCFVIPLYGITDSYTLLGVVFEAIRWSFCGMSTVSDSKRELCGARNYRREIQKKCRNKKNTFFLHSYDMSLLMR